VRNGQIIKSGYGKTKATPRWISDGELSQDKAHQSETYAGQFGSFNHEIRGDGELDCDMVATLLKDKG
jgi:hypothetical protein